MKLRNEKKPEHHPLGRPGGPVFKHKVAPSGDSSSQWEASWVVRGAGTMKERWTRLNRIFRLPYYAPRLFNRCSLPAPALN